MRVVLTVFVISVLCAGILVAAGAGGVIDLSTLGKKPKMTPLALPKLTPNMPSYTGANVSPSKVIDLSTLGKAKLKPALEAVLLKGHKPVTVTPSFSIRNANITAEAGTVFTLPQAISRNATVYTPPIAIFGGA